MSKVKEILRRKEERKTKLQVSLDSIVSQLKNIGALRIILFGSFAKGDIDVYSDLDLLVIMPSAMSGKEWMKLVYGDVKREVSSDIIVYNLREFEENLPISSFLQNIVNLGRIVYEKTT
jgi:predicted nucleotidyltransferase